MGNPVVYRNKVCEWEQLKNLSIYDSRGLAVQYKYNASNLRMSKDYTVSDTASGENTRYTTDYTWSGDRLISQTQRATTNEWKQSAEPAGVYDQDLTIDTVTTKLDF